MFETIDRLRKKPESARRKIALSISLTFTLVIFCFWLFVIYPNVKDSNYKNQPNNATTTPLSDFGAMLSEGYRKIKDIKDSINLPESLSNNFSTTSIDFATSTEFSDSNYLEIQDQNE